MDFSYSPSHDAGGTLLHLSPSHGHYTDPALVRNLRRSLSRSPSKHHFSNQKSPSRPLRFCATAPNTPHNLSARHHASMDDFHLPSAKKPRPTLRRTTPLNFSSNGNSPVESPLHRALSDSSDNGNANVNTNTNTNNKYSTTPAASPSSGTEGQENCDPSLSQDSSGSGDDALEKSPLADFRNSHKALPIVSRVPTFRTTHRTWRPAQSSPLKRSDAAAVVMSLSQNPPSSPSAKRRTICGGVVSSPFGTVPWDGDLSMSDCDAEESDDDNSSHELHRRSAAAPKGLSLRRTKPFLRPSEKSASPARRSLELNRDSPRHTRSRPHLNTNFPASSPARNDRTEPEFPDLADITRAQYARPMRAQPHPLSKALSPTSPTPTTKEQQFSQDSHERLVFQSPSAPAPDFAKSLPIGALRPTAEQPQNSNTSSDKSSFESSFATPKPYHIAKPDPAAFRSTGLISKKHRNPDDIPPPPAAHAGMPDTPCKRISGAFTFSASPTPQNSVVKEQRLSQPAFGTPSKSFGITNAAAPVSSRQSTHFFGNQLELDEQPPKESIVYADGEDGFHSPQGPSDSQSSADELPPTPTKQNLGVSTINKQNSLRSALLGRRPSIGPSTFLAPESADTDEAQGSSCRSHPSNVHGVISNHQNNSSSGQPRVVHPTDLGCSGRSVPPSLSSSRTLRGHLKRRTQSPLSESTQCHQSTYSINQVCANPIFHQSVFQPLPPSSSNGSVPQTPIDNSVPDPSGLSISPNCRKTTSPAGNGTFAKPASLTPATPTHRDGFAAFPFNRPLMTPSNHAFAKDVDPVLSRRFKKVEWYGRGNFSEVYKVSESQEPVPVQSYFSSSVGSPASQTSAPDKLYIVKKTKMPYTSMKIRQRKLREAAIMSALGKNDHTVHLISSWEASGHIYIQTEFCEEGSLEQFLAKIGSKGRLDDFRIWKILIELTEGLKHIHDRGFIHLDLKPANVFIDFAGVLKIGDFGLATEWPAPKNVEGEGDRRYIGPDLLQGAFDKPADVFALGMMMFEIAGNCELPDNGTYWHHLRSGHWSDLPSLTSASSYSASQGSRDDIVSWNSLQNAPRAKLDDQSSHQVTPGSQSWQGDFKTGPQSNDFFDGATQPPRFMQDPEDSEALEQVVHWMMEPNPADRPVVDQILQAGGCKWVDARRRAGAVVFEGPWGPPNHVLASYEQQPHEDHEMLDAP